MSPKAWMLGVALTIGSSWGQAASAKDFKDMYCPFTFKLGAEWTNPSPDLFSPSSRGGESINNPYIPDAAHHEPIEDVVMKVSMFHGMAFGTPQNAPSEKVIGQGWTGILQQRGTGEPGTEFQLVARSTTATCAYYLSMSNQTDPARLAELKALLLGMRYTP
ncbi:hypothetical protein [Stenotrophomonas bentonitica]